jgi:hypothetical protein
MENGVSVFSANNFIVNFRRADGSIIHRDLKLTDDGKIVPSLPNEFWWDHVDGNLVFKNEAGDVTTVFDRHVKKSDHIEIHGRFLPLSNDVYHHILELFPLSKIGILPSAKLQYVSYDKLKVAVFLRTHVINPKFYGLYNRIKSEISDFDVFPLIDNSRGAVNVNAEDVIFHSTADVEKYFLKSSRENLFWWCGDYPLYIAYMEKKNYDYYIMIEYDVEFLENPALYINKLVEKLSKNPSIDLVSLDLRRHYQDWAWWKQSRLYFDDVWSIFFPFVCISRRALSFLMSIRQNELFRNIDDQYILHCEPFVAGNLILSGFKCYDLNEILPNSYTISLMKIQGGYNSKANLDLKINHLSMIHPVYEPLPHHAD